jgi:hypothetical protein
MKNHSTSQPLHLRVRLRLKPGIHQQALEFIAGKTKAELTESMALLLQYGALYKLQIERSEALQLLSSALPQPASQPSVATAASDQSAGTPAVQADVSAGDLAVLDDGALDGFLDFKPS